MDTPPHPAVSQPPTPYLQGISWKRRVAFPGRPWDGECGTPCGNLLLINATEPRTLCRLGALSSESGLHMGARGLPSSAPPLPSPGHLQGAREGAGWARMAAAQGTSPSSLNRPGERVQVLVSRPGALGPSSQHLPCPDPPQRPAGAGDGDPCTGLCSAPEGTQGTGCERHPEAFHGDPVFPRDPFGADARNLSVGECDASEPSAHPPARREVGRGRGRARGGQAARSAPGGAWPCAHRRGTRVPGRAARGAWDPRITAPARPREPRGQGRLFSATSARAPALPRAVKVKRDAPSGSKVLGPRHALVRAPGPLPSRPLRCVRGVGHSLRPRVQAGKSRVGRQAWTPQGTISSGNLLAPVLPSGAPAPRHPEEARGTDFSLRPWKVAVGAHARCSGSCGPVRFPEAGGPGSAVQFPPN